MKTLCIDARLYGIAHTGIGRYVENLVRFLPRDRSVRTVLIVAPENENNPDLDGFDKITARYHPYSPLSQAEMLWIWARIRPDLLHVTHPSIPVFWPGKIVVTFHDLIKHYSRGPRTTTHQNKVYYWIKYAGYIMVDRISAVRARRIIVPSNYWKKELIRNYRLPGGKIVVIYEGVDRRVLGSRVGDPFALPRPYVVYTGNVYPHKNVEVLAKAVSILKGKVRLAVAGARSVFTTRLEQLVDAEGIGGYTHLLGRVSDREMAGLYRHASAFVFPSLIEGFGLTGLEAMAAGLPVIAARASCLPEVYGDAALYFDPHSAADLADKITLILGSKKLRGSLAKKGLLQASKYSWSKMSEETWQIYRKELH